MSTSGQVRGSMAPSSLSLTGTIPGRGLQSEKDNVFLYKFEPVSPYRVRPKRMSSTNEEEEIPELNHGRAVFVGRASGNDQSAVWYSKNGCWMRTSVIDVGQKGWDDLPWEASILRSEETDADDPQNVQRWYYYDGCNWSLTTLHHGERNAPRSVRKEGIQ
jgi:hypothetical protein